VQLTLDLDSELGDDDPTAQQSRQPAIRSPQ
jgi:hypothetical protein